MTVYDDDALRNIQEGINEIDKLDEETRDRGGKKKHRPKKAKTDLHPARGSGDPKFSIDRAEAEGTQAPATEPEEEVTLHGGLEMVSDRHQHKLHGQRNTLSPAYGAIQHHSQDVQPVSVS